MAQDKFKRKLSSTIFARPQPTGGFHRQKNSWTNAIEERPHHARE
jgi:hypothetical protein